MTGAHDDDEHSGGEPDAPKPWHHSTAKVLGASIAGLLALVLVVVAVMFVSREAETPQAPLNFVDPTFTSATTDPTTSSTATTTTRISPPLTTDLDLPPELAPPPPPPSETSTSRGRSTTQEEESERSGEESAPPTSTRSRPRLNETRTLYPPP